MTSDNSVLSHLQHFSQPQDVDAKHRSCLLEGRHTWLKPISPSTKAGAQSCVGASLSSVGGSSWHSSSSALPKGRIFVQPPFSPSTTTEGTVHFGCLTKLSAVAFNKWVCQGYLQASITPLPRNFIWTSLFLPDLWTASKAAQSVVMHRPVLYSHVSRHTSPGKHRAGGVPGAGHRWSCAGSEVAFGSPC